MKWNLLETGTKSGDFNMDFDTKLIEQALEDQVFLRFYRWKPYCISLGFNQTIDSINVKKAKEEGIDIVRRPTGGRAILHAEELTYSIIHPIDNSLTPKNLYHKINLALKKGLEIYHPALQKIGLEHNQPHFQNFYKEDKSSLCFAISAKSEINYQGRKLVGSAQRKIGNLVLQHGSILCGNIHLNLVDFLNMSDEEKVKIKGEIKNITTDISSIIDEEVDYERLKDSLKAGFEEHFNLVFDNYQQEILLN